MIDNGKRKVALDALKAFADELRTEIEQKVTALKHELSAVEQSIRTLSGNHTQVIGPPGPDDPHLMGGKYAGLGPQPAVELFLKEQRPNRHLRPAQVAARMKAEGFTVTNPKLLTQQVAIALSRAVGKGLAVQGVRQGKKAYASTHDERAGKTEDAKDEDNKRERLADADC